MKCLLLLKKNSNNKYIWLNNNIHNNIVSDVQLSAKYCFNGLSHIHWVGGDGKLYFNNLKLSNYNRSFIPRYYIFLELRFSKTQENVKNSINHSNLI